MPEATEIMKLLSDATRLRILRLLSSEELSVAELQTVLDMGQSRISSHLALLKGAELVTDRREGKRSFYSHNGKVPTEIEALVHAAVRAMTDSETFTADDVGLERVLQQRRDQSKDYFDSVAGRLSRQYCPGRSWEAIGHAILQLIPALDVADLGAGEGILGQLLARRARQVTCIDNAPKMVEVGEELARRNHISNLSYRLGDIESVPMPDDSVDLALFSQALHHATKPQIAIAEASRILRPGGRILILDLREHQFEQARELYADVWLGFSENQLYRWLKEVGFRDVQTSIVARETEGPCFETLLATAIKAPPESAT